MENRYEKILLQLQVKKIVKNYNRTTKVDGQYCYVKVIINKRVITLLKKKFWSVLMVKKVLKHQVIGSYLLNFITVMFQLQNIADIIVGQTRL